MPCRVSTICVCRGLISPSHTTSLLRVDLKSVAAAVVRNEPGAFEKFIEEAQGRSFDEMSAAALGLSSSPDLQANL